MLFATLVVQQRLAPHRSPDIIRIQVTGDPSSHRAHGHFQAVQCPARVALAGPRDQFQRLVIRLKGPQTTLLVFRRGVQHLPNGRFVQRIEHEYLRSRKQRRIHLERGILCRGPDQDDRPVLHVREEGILLSPVEPVDLIYE